MYFVKLCPSFSIKKYNERHGSCELNKSEFLGILSQYPAFIKTEKDDSVDSISSSVYLLY